MTHDDPTDYGGPWPPPEEFIDEVYEHGYPIEIMYYVNGQSKEAENAMAKVDAVLAAKPDTKKALVLAYALRGDDSDHIWLSSRTFTGGVSEVEREVELTREGVQEDGCEVLGMVLAVVTEDMLA